MPVGMTSSKNLQQTETAPVLRSGQTLATTVEAVKNPNAKTYFHGSAGARFIMPDGLELCFLGGRFTTDDAEIIKELDKVANIPTSQIFTQQETASVLKAQADAVAQEAAVTAGTEKS